MLHILFVSVPSGNICLIKIHVSSYLFYCLLCCMVILNSFFYYCQYIGIILIFAYVFFY